MNKLEMIDRTRVRIVNRPFGKFTVEVGVNVITARWKWSKVKDFKYEWTELDLHGRPMRGWCNLGLPMPPAATFDTLSEAELYKKWYLTRDKVVYE